MGVLFFHNLSTKKATATIFIGAILMGLAIEVLLASMATAQTGYLPPPIYDKITVLSPQNQTFNQDYVTLEFLAKNSYDPNRTYYYSLDGRGQDIIGEASNSLHQIKYQSLLYLQQITYTVNLTFTEFTLDCKAALPRFSDGQHNITIYISLDNVHDISPNQPYDPVSTFYFYVNSSIPLVSILSPENRSYNDSAVPLITVVREPALIFQYNLDGQASEPITGNATLIGLSSGEHIVVVYARFSIFDESLGLNGGERYVNVNSEAHFIVSSFSSLTPTTSATVLPTFNQTPTSPPPTQQQQSPSVIPSQSGSGGNSGFWLDFRWVVVAVVAVCAFAVLAAVLIKRKR